MAKLIYSTINSIDGYVADEQGNFDWDVVDEELHSFVNDLERPIGTYLYGRKMYEVMTYWETADDDEAFLKDYAQIWQAAEKVVYSRTLEQVATKRTRLVTDFDVETIRTFKDEQERDISIGGPDLAAQAIRAGLIDEYHFFVAPVVVGGGTSSLPDDVRLGLELLTERRFGNGVVHLHYRPLIDAGVALVGRRRQS